MFIEKDKLKKHILRSQLELTLTRSFVPVKPSTKQSKQAAKNNPPPSDPAPTGGAPMDDAAPPPQTASTGVETSNPNAGMSQDACVKAIHKSLNHPTVRFLRDHMEKAGCPVWARILMAGTCKDQTSAGGYAHRYGVTVCCNHMSLQDEVNQVIIHELIHAYDDCRAKNMDWKNCAHHACSEIRANHLSGDCHYKRELLRGFMKIRGHEQECVKRRALKSVMKNPHCSEAASKDAIEAVWDICYNDTYPFDRAP